jgi:alcohol dehydrogenase class IV
VLDDGRKVTIVSPNMIPPTAICDPDLTLGLPPKLTAATGMDAITHCIESVLAPPVNPPADAVGLDGLERGWAYIERAVADGNDKEARWQMMMAATEGAMAFIKGLGAVHAMSHALGRLKEPLLHHGTLNAVILPTILRFNQGHDDGKYERLRRAMGLAAGADLAEAVEAMNARLGLPKTLGEMGVTEAMIPDLLPHTVSDLANWTNPRKADEAAYEALYREAIG